MDKTNIFSFNKRYLVVGVLIYILSSYISIGLNITQYIKPHIFILYTTVFTSTIVAVYFFTRLMLRNRETRTLMSSGLISVLVFIFGFSYCTMYANTLDIKRGMILSCNRVSGVITQDPSVSNSGKSRSFVVDVHSANSDTTTFSFDKKCYVLVFIPKDSVQDDFKTGDSINITGCKLITSSVDFDGDFNYYAYLRQNKILCPIYAHSIAKTEPFPEKYPFIAMLKSAGASIRNVILKSTELNTYKSDEKALLRGILIGDTEMFSDELYGKYTNSGFIHIASVSGMHTSYLFMAIAFILSVCRFPRKFVLLITIPILVLFASVAMFTPSVCRAVIMLIMLLVAGIIGRDNDSVTALFTSALILSLENPYCLYSYSFLMSFGATLGILIYYQLLRKRLSFAVISPKQPSGILRKTLYKANTFAVDSICLSIGGTIGLAYFTMRFFGKLQWGGIIGNIFIFPFTAIAFIGGYANSIVFCISPVLAEYIAKTIINPALILTNHITAFFSAGIFRFNTFSPPKSFFPIYLFICVVIYILLKPKKENAA